MERENSERVQVNTCNIVSFRCTSYNVIHLHVLFHTQR